MLNKEDKHFRIHGDNIVECERTLSLITKALGCDDTNIIGPSGSSICPSFTINSHDAGVFHFTFFPGFGRWKQDILSIVHRRGGVLREAADALITKILPAGETPVLAIEYCAALAAGNQAWQRNGRAYSFARAGVPYLYVVEFGGFELDSERQRKTARLPNPAVPFSYLSCSDEYGTPNLPVYVHSPGADKSIDKIYGDVFGEKDLTDFIARILLATDISPTYQSLRNKAIKLVMILSENRSGDDSLDPQSWAEAEKAVHSGVNLVQYLASKKPIKWSKTAYIESLTSTAATLMKIAAKYAIGLTSANLPMCLIPATNITRFAMDVQKIYPSLPENFKNWLREERILTICWVMGFKPRGDDARPDRGLPALTRMLIGEATDMLTVVYGPAKKETWPLLHKAPLQLIEQNGLWEVIMNLSDAILIDSATDTEITEKGYLDSHWATKATQSTDTTVLVSPEPDKFAENDVDTVLHMVFARFGGNKVFEGMCNPPGGDWSGISLIADDCKTELRWLSLPRVSINNSKRPDHVFQIFGLEDKPVVLIVESKETSESVEDKIGPRLEAYLTALVKSPASCERPLGTNRWQHSPRTLNTTNIKFATGAAFLCAETRNIDNIVHKAQCDIAMCLEFVNGGTHCKIHTGTTSSLGEKIRDFLKLVVEKATLISIED